MIACAVALSVQEPSSDICEALGVSRATLYRAITMKAEGPAGSHLKRNVTPDEGLEDGEPPAARVSPRALTPEERERMLSILNSEPFADMAPPQVYTSLLDEGHYLASVSTMYRLLRQHDQVRERRDQLTHPVYARPELMATRCNEVWSWDITKLRGPVKGTYYCLYVILDLFSRYVAHWTLQLGESQEIAAELIRQSCEKQNVESNQLTVHADRGSAMTSKTLAELMMELGVAKSHSRPHTSNDNPFSEAQFKTMKYRPRYPSRFSSIEEARAFSTEFFRWYNREHYHSGIAMVTPEAMHYGEAKRVIEKRAGVLAAAQAVHPERFVNKQPVPPPLPTAVWINPPLPNGTVNNGTN